MLIFSLALIHVVYVCVAVRQSLLVFHVIDHVDHVLATVVTGGADEMCMLQERHIMMKMSSEVRQGCNRD